MRIYLNAKEVIRFPKFGWDSIEPFFTAIAPAAPTLRDAFTLGAKISAMALGVGVPVISHKIGQHRVVCIPETLISDFSDQQIEAIFAQAETEARHDV